jgi:hypothetical protein
MGSRTKALRKAQSRELRLATTRLYARATKGEVHKLENCWDVHPGPHRVVVAGWALEAAVSHHAHPDTDEPVEHWHLSLQLHPEGRPERNEDWMQLGAFVRRFATLTGYDGAELDPVRSLDAAPHAPHHFIWHPNGPPIPAEVRRVVDRTVRILHAADQQEGA